MTIAWVHQEHIAGRFQAKEELKRSWMDQRCPIKTKRQNTTHRREKDDQANTEDLRNNCAGPYDPHLTWKSKDSRAVS